MSKDLFLYAIGAVIMLTVVDHTAWSGWIFDIGWALFGCGIVVEALKRSAEQPKLDPSKRLDLEEWLLK